MGLCGIVGRLVWDCGMEVELVEDKGCFLTIYIGLL